MQRKPCQTNFKSLTRPRHQKRASVTDISRRDRNATPWDRCAVCQSCSEQRPCTSSAPAKAYGPRPDPDESGSVDVDTVLGQNSRVRVPMALCSSPCPVQQALMTCVAQARDSSASVSVAIDKKMDCSYARICARVPCGRTLRRDTPRNPHTHQPQKGHRTCLHTSATSGSTSPAKLRSHWP